MEPYELWVDFMTMRDDGTLRAWTSDLRGGRTAAVGDILIVGSEDSNPARAEVLRIDGDGRILLQVLDVARGSAENVTTLAEEIESELAGELVEAVVLGPSAGDADAQGNLEGAVLDWATARTELDVEFPNRYGAFRCRPFFVWTPTRVLFLVEYDGRWRVGAVPRSPTVGRARSFGGSFVADLQKDDDESGQPHARPRKTIRGLWKGTSTSAEAIAEVRREMHQSLLGDEADEVWPEIIDVTGVRVLARYVLELTFENGETRVIDIEPHLGGEVFEPLLADYDLFCQVRADPEIGTIVWPNSGDISPRTLYVESKPAVPVQNDASGGADSRPSR